MSTEDRLAALEEGMAVASANDRVLAGYMRRTLAREAQTEAAQLEARLAPSSLVGTSLRASAGGGPDLGSPLMDRLRADGSLGHSVAGSPQAVQASGNLLKDAALEYLYPTTETVTTSWVRVNRHWEMRYVLNSGTTPTSVELGRALERVQYSQLSSAIAAITVIWADAANITVQLRTYDITSSIAAVDWPYTVAAVRILQSSVGPNTTVCTATVSVLDSAKDKEDESEPADLLVLADIDGEARPFAVSEPAGGVGQQGWQLDVTLDNATGSGAPSDVVRFMEPTFAYTDEESPPTFQPAVGDWNPIPYLVGANAVRTTNQSIDNGSWTSLLFPTAGGAEDYDPFFDAHHDMSTLTGRFYIRHRGIYLAGMQAAFAPEASGVRKCRIERNKAGGGTRIEAVDRAEATSSGSTVVGCSRPFLAIEDDYLQFQVWQDRTSGALDVQGDGSDVETSAWLHLLAYDLS